MKISTHPLRAAAVLALALGLAGSGRCDAPDLFPPHAPEWLAATVAQPTPADVGRAPAVVLLDDTSSEIDAQGVAVDMHRRAVRILHVSGRDSAIASVFYNGVSDRVLSANAWLLRNGRVLYSRENYEWVDLAANDPLTAIEEMRSRQVSLESDAIPGDVFAFETRVNSPLLVAQRVDNFQETLPVETERYTLKLPPGFSVKPALFGPHQPELSWDNGGTWTWTLTGSPYRPDEILAAPSSSVDAELVVSLVSPAQAPAFGPRAFSNWSDVAAMLEALNAAQCDSSPELSAKVRELTAGRPDALAKIRALGAYVQKLRYIEIDQGLRYGFGWQARKASLVFARGFGDCKDKANLLVAMLREAGIGAHLVVARPGRDFAVHQECPTPMQFDHAIVAIKVDDSIRLPSVVAVEKLGRLLFFDPTDPYTLVGDLPDGLQGSQVYVLAAGNNFLTGLPDFAAQDDYVLKRSADLSLSPEGALTVVGRLRASGQVGSALRAKFEADTQPKDLEQFVSDQLSNGFRGAAVQEKKTDDDRSADRSTLSFTCVQPDYIQRIQGGIAILKLDVFSRRYPIFPEKERVLPIALHPIMIRDVISLSLAGGYAVDELPAKVSIKTAYGSYQSSCAIDHNSLVLRRTLLINRNDVPLEDYAKVRQFFNAIARADRTSVLLRSGTVAGP
jgi:transglutaminase-like putative cysteine protease